MKPKRLCFVVNPYSGNGRGRKIMETIKPLFDDAGITSDIHETQFGGHAKEIAAGLDFSVYDGIVSVGGDGSMHQVLNGMLAHGNNPDVILGVIPGGSGNAFMESLGCLDPVEAAKIIIKGETAPVDAASIILGGKALWASNIVGWGFVTDVQIFAEKNRWMRGNQYTVGGAIKIMQGKKRKAKLVISGVETDEIFTFIIACNTPYTGRGMLMAPKAKMNDGLIDLLIVRKASRLQMLKLLPAVFEGKHIHSPVVDYRQVSEFSLIPEVDEPINLDGELVGMSPLHLKMVPAAYRMYM